ncbi:MAG: o-succinylbenzoate--CoA ligase [Gemmatimonadaceae bacterium]
MTSHFDDWLARHAANHPGHPALVAGDRTWSYAALDAEVTTLAGRLATLGVRDGDRVASLLHNGAHPALLVHATLRLGATLVPLNVRLSPAEIAWQVADARPALLLVEARTAPRAEVTRRDLPSLRVADVATLREVAAADAPLRATHDAAHVLAIIYTSGTTGRPKGAMLTVGNFWWSAEGSARNLGVRPDDRWLAVLPLFHVGGLSILLRAAIYGTTAVVHEAFDAHAVNAAIEREGITIVSVVAVLLQRMLDARGELPFPDSLRCVLLGGGPAPRPLLERCAAMHVPVVQTYGLTETASQVATLAPGEALRRLGSAGRVLPPNELRVVGNDGREARAGEPGEIQVRGPVVMAGYANRDDATARALEGGWLHTGDVGALDADGYLYVLDRRDDLIISGGENVYPAEVEAALLADPRVAECGVIGEPDAEWGQRVVAVVRLHDEALVGASTAESLRAHCRERLARYKAPAEIRFVTQPLPRTASGKLRRAALKPS